MTKIIYGKKIGMGEAYIGDVRSAVTQISLYPMTVTQLKTLEKDGYEAMQVGFGTPKKHSKAKLGKHRELPQTDGLELGSTINPKDVVSVGMICNVQGTSKGKGFAGVVKRWNFAGGPRTHGQSDRLRAPGSIGQGTTPGRVHKGKKMAGRMGSDTVTAKQATIISFNELDNTIWVTGPVPGARHSLVRLSILDQKELGDVVYITGGLPKVIVPETPVGSPVAPVAATDSQVEDTETEGVKQD